MKVVLCTAETQATGGNITLLSFPDANDCVQETTNTTAYITSGSVG